MTITRITLAAVALLMPALGCHDEKAHGAHSSGGEHPLEAAEKSANQAHEHFKQAVRPAADVVDQKAHQIVDEGKKAVNKVAGDGK